MEAMRILLIGGSVRAAASSVRRLGGVPVAFDLYRDADLVAIADATRIESRDYPDQIWDRVRHLPPSPWMYTGAIENYPSVVETISRRFLLVGNGPQALRSTRDPFWLASIVRDAGFLMPEVRKFTDLIPRDGSWLVKPFASGGGERIMAWQGERSSPQENVYFQAHQPGRSLGATFLRDDGGSRLLGLTRQFVGRPGNRFAYRGSLGPWPMSESIRRQVTELGQLVGDQANLRGLFGVDLIESDGRIWLIEVNPRYTASVEVLEAALNRSFLADHFRAFGINPATTQIEGNISPTIVGKAILFAQTSGCLRHSIPTETPGVADIPHPGTHFERGHPMMTVFGQGDSVADCKGDLARQLRYWKTRFRLVPELRPEC